MPTIAFPTPFAGAIWCAEHGFKVFPLRKGASLADQKKPAVANWESCATTDKSKIAQWEADHPGANWAVACGPSGLLVIDLDDKGEKRGSEEWKKLREQHGQSASTLTVRSASGRSWHLYFRGEGRSTSSQLAPGIDSRGLGGYVVAPGAAFINLDGEIIGRYEVEFETEIIPAPDWVVSALSLRKGPAPPITEFIPEGQRDSTLTSLGGSMRQRGFDYAEIYAALTIANEKRCKPPLGDEDVSRISRSVCRYEPGRAERDVAAEHALAAANAAPEEESISCASSILTENLPLRDWVVPGRYLRGAMSLTIGPGGSSKSSLALLEAVAIASGRGDLAGFYYDQEPKQVLYYNAEDPKAEIERRIAALCIRHGLKTQDLNSLFYLSGFENNALRFGASDEKGRMVLNTTGLTWLESQSRRFDLIILDPWASLHSGHENDNVAIDNLCRAVIRAASTSALHVIHHSRKLGKDSGEGDAEIARGASSLVAASRYAVTLRGMSKEDAEEMGIPETARHTYCRRDDAKANFVPSALVAVWYQRENIYLPHLTFDTPAQGVVALVHIDAKRIAAEESQYRGLLAGLLPEIMKTEIMMGVYEIAKAIVKEPEHRDLLGGGTVSTMRRRIETVLGSKSLLLENGVVVAMRFDSGRHILIRQNLEDAF